MDKNYLSYFNTTNHRFSSNGFNPDEAVSRSND